MSGSSTNTVQETSPVVSSLRLQTSCMGRPIPWLFGRTRVAPNLIDYDDFTPTEHRETQSAGGKGGGGSTITSVSYTYTTALIMAISSGPVESIGTVWKDKEVTNLAAIGLDFYNGSNTQTAYPHFATNHPSKALNYPGIAYVAAGAYDLKTSPSLDNHSFEVQSPVKISASIPDADPADIISAILTDKEQGLGMDLAYVDMANFSTFCRAAEIYVSPAYTEQSPAYDKIKRLLQIGFADCVYSGGIFKVVPYYDSQIVGALATYTPNFGTLPVLTEDDFLSQDDPIKHERRATEDSYNDVTVKFLNRALDYNDDVASVRDLADIEQTGLRSMDTVELKEICDPAVANRVADFILHRSLYIRNEYEFQLPWKYITLEPMDVVLIYYPRLGYNNTPVLITEIDEDETGVLTVKAEDYPIGANKFSSRTPPTCDSFTPNFAADPGNATVPAMFEAPLQLTGNDPQLWLATAGGPDWGGCEVWASFDDVSYKRIGTTTARSRYGVTTSALGLGSAIDTLNTLGVDLSAASGTLLGGTHSDAEAKATLCFVDGEFLAYADATLTGVSQYNLAYLVRGLYGTDIAAHTSNKSFIRVDDALFKYSYPKEYVGRTIFIKLVSFNQFGGGQQNLSAVPRYSYTLVGAPLGAVMNLRQMTPFSASNDATLAWDVLDGADSYDVQVYAGATLVRTLTAITSNQFTYRVEDAKADGGPWRSLTVKARGRSITGNVGQWASLVVTNPQSGALANVRVDNGMGCGFFKCDTPTDSDFAGVMIWASSDPSCPTIDGNKVYDGPNTFVVISKLADNSALVAGTTYYVKAAAYDTFGKDSLSYSTGTTFTPLNSDISPNSITAAMLQDGILTTGKFAAGLEPVGVVSSLPSLTGYTGPKVVLLTTDGKTYRALGGSWVKDTAATDITGQLVASQISAGAIGTTQLAANAVTAKSLAVTDFENLVTNPSGAFGATEGWTGLGGVGFSSVGTDTNGFYLNKTAGVDIYGNSNIPVKSGDEFWVSCDAEYTSGNAYFTMGFLFRDGNGVGTYTQQIWIGINGVTDTSAGFKTYSKALVAPAWAKWAWVWLQGPSSGLWKVRNIQVKRRNTGNLIVDGAITANKIAANSITAGQIASGTITATQILANSITGDRLVLNTITANQIATGTLTATQIQAGSLTGDRLAAGTVSADKIDSRGLSIKDASGNVILAAGTALDFANVGGATKPSNNAGKVIDGGTGTAAGQRQCNDPPSYYPVGKTQQFKWSLSVGIADGGSWISLETNKQYRDNSGGMMTQWAYGQSGGTWKRYAYPADSVWGAWVQDLDRAAYTGDLNATYGATDATLNAGLGVNLLPNTEFNGNNIDYWTQGWNPSGTPIIEFLSEGIGGVDTTWAPYGGRSLRVGQAGPTNPAYNIAVEVWPVGGYSNGRIPVKANQRYEFSVKVANHRCNVGIGIVFVDSTNANISEASQTESVTEYSGGTTLGTYNQMCVFAVAPANAVACFLYVRKYDTKAGQTSSYLFITQPYFGEATAAQTVPSKYAPGSPRGALAQVSQITSGNASTYIANAAIGAAQIGSISLVGVGNFNVKSATAGARTEMDSQVIKVFDASGVLRVKLGNLGA